jgi:glutamine amidotransferase-like uncharacterized protein
MPDKRSLTQLANDAAALAAHTKMNQAVALVVTQEEKKVLDHFVKGISGPGGCTHLHGCPIRVEGEHTGMRVLLIYQNLNECDFQASVITSPTDSELVILTNAHNEFAAAGEENEQLEALDTLAEEVVEKENWEVVNPATLLDRAPFNLVVICGRNY